MEKFSFFLNRKEQRDENKHVSLNSDWAICGYSQCLSATIGAAVFQFMQEEDEEDVIEADMYNTQLSPPPRLLITGAEARGRFLCNERRNQTRITNAAAFYFAMERGACVPCHGTRRMEWRRGDEWAQV
jgi:hypothetical protein